MLWHGLGVSRPCHFSFADGSETHPTTASRARGDDRAGGRGVLMTSERIEKLRICVAQRTRASREKELQSRAVFGDIIVKDALVLIAILASVAGLIPACRRCEEPSAAPPAAAVDEKAFLLTANGRGDSQAAAYKKAAVGDPPKAGSYAAPELDAERGNAPKPTASGAGPAGAVTDAEGMKWYAFQFGPTNSPAVPLFTRVTKDMLCTKATGYGWTVPTGNVGKPMNEGGLMQPSSAVAGLIDRDRATDKTVVDPVSRAFVGAEGAYHPQTRHQFVADVPDGHYLAVTFHSDITYGRFGRQHFSIDAQGKRVVEDPYFDSIYGRCEFETDVANGQLALVFDGTKPDVRNRNWQVNGLVLFPYGKETERAFAAKKVDLILSYLREARHVTKDYVEKPHIETNPMPPTSAEDRARGFVVFVPNWMEMVYQNTVPTDASLKRRLTAFACRGEREPYAIAVRSLAPLKQVTFSVTDLHGPAIIPATAFDLRVVRYYPQRIGSSWSREWCVMPQILDPNHPVDLPAHTTQEFWLTVRVPASAKSGLYAGNVTLACGKARAVVPITLEVLPFDLAGPGKWVGMYWRPEQCDSRETLRLELADMRAHGMSCAACNVPEPKFKLVDGKLTVDAAETTAFLDLLWQNGFTGPIPVMSWDVESAAKALYGAARMQEGVRPILREYIKVATRPNSPPLLFYPVDEIGHAKDLQEELLRKGEMLHKVPGAKVFCTVNEFAAGQRCVEQIDYWCSNVPLTLEQEQFVREQGKVYMRYGSHYTKDPRQARDSAGFGFIRRNAVAMYYWHYQAYVGDPFDDLDGNSRDWCAAYPGKDGPIPTLDWEGVGEGVDDLRYMNTLRTLAEQCRTQGGAASQKAAKAVAELERLLAADATTSAYDFMKSLSDDEFNALRRKVVDLILPLNESLTKKPLAPFRGGTRYSSPASGR